MKILPVLLLLLLLPQCASAQEQRIYVESFDIDPLDMTAKEHPRRDASGNLYAIIKVRPSAKDFKFDFGYINHIDGGEHDGETWIYVQRSARRFSISREGYVPIKGADLGMTIEAGATYVMNISYTAPKVRKQMVQFVITPPGVPATVMIRSDENAPYTLFGMTGAKSDVSKNLELGAYFYQVMAENHENVVGTLMLDNENETLVEQIYLTPNTATTTVRVEADAEIYIDGELKGTRMWSGALPPGDYNVEVRMKNHTPSTDRITVKSGEARTFTVAPPKPITGTVSVITEPSGANILIDGQAYGRTPRNVPDVLIGDHTLTLTLPDYKEVTNHIAVKQNQITDVNLTLKPLSAIAVSTRKASDRAARREQQPQAQYWRPGQFYVQPTLQVGTFMGAGVALGGYISNFNVEVSFLYGLGGDDTFYWNNDYTRTSTQLEGNFTKYYAGGKLGYGLSLGSRLRLTPQLGVGVVGFNHSSILPKSSAITASVGARLDVAVANHVGLFIAPEGSFAISQSEGFKAVADVSSKVKGWATGFNARLGVTLFF